ncbi:NAD(P)/FAD-dependent oxidoreductase [Flavobacterium sp.]|jgi:flavin-dependent dehydrogenase|uniref:NAD(P)/FAD-dependent oxidoreductase n=1 Tax=Flavobacterium sp. TaxID=239 RepID=UPI0037BF90B0
MQPQIQVAIIGGGLAGLTAAIHLRQKGYIVTLFEKNDYPKHKVCGEFISNEVLPYWESLGIDIQKLQPTTLTQTVISIPTGKQLETVLPLGGFGISRYTLDFYLYTIAREAGCQIISQQVNAIEFLNDSFTIHTEKGERFQAKVVLGAFGKRSNLDVQFKRDFIQKKSPWLAVKAHYSGDFPNDLVALHNFEGGYCGVSKVEDNRINICYLVKFDVFKRYKNIEDFQTNVLYQNPHLKSILEQSTLLFVKPLTISQISFEKKAQVESRILMLGDTAGLIHPLCGNGMAMAIHSAKIASECVVSFLEGKQTRDEMEKSYASQWKYHFQKRLQAGKQLSKLLLNASLSAILMKLLLTFPKLLPLIIQRTHGKPIS